MDKEINRIKAVLVEKKEPINGWLNSWGVHLLRCQNVVPLTANLQWKQSSKSQSILKWN